MDATELAEVRLRLLRRRRELLEASRRAHSGIDQLRGADRAREPAEASQSEQLQDDLSRLGEVEQRELAQLDAAIARLDAGEYGVCRTCGEEIAGPRLGALPFVLECAECASHREEATARRGKRRARAILPE